MLFTFPADKSSKESDQNQQVQYEGFSLAKAGVRQKIQERTVPKTAAFDHPLPTVMLWQQSGCLYGTVANHLPVLTFSRGAAYL